MSLVEQDSPTVVMSDGSQYILVTSLPTPQLQQENIDPQQTVEHAAKSPDIGPPIGKAPFSCDICSKVFPRWPQLQRHRKAHEDDKPFACDQCPSTFNVEHNLILHQATHAVEDPTCPECGKKFSRVASLKAHVMLHEVEESVMCTECGDEFSLQRQLDKHMQEHREEQEGTRTYVCKQCLLEFPKLTLLRDHMRVHYKFKASLAHRRHKSNIDRSSFHHKCKHCGKCFQKPSQLRRHVRIHTGERPFKCESCDKAFNQKGALQMHMHRHTGEKPHMCEFCPMTFAQKGNLRSHIMRVHSNREGATFVCEECCCVFKKLGSLNAHISRAHSCFQEELPTQVEVRRTTEASKTVNDVIQQLLELSEQSAGDPEATQQHIQQIASQGNISQDILQQAIENSGLSSMNAGVRVPKPSTSTADGEAPTSDQTATETGETAAASTSMSSTVAVHDAATGKVSRHLIRKANGVRWHQCTYCSKEFKKPSDLVRHIRIHTCEKPYKCNQCYRAFTVKSTLTAHQRTHAGIKDYKCHVCFKLFSTQGSLKVHLRLHTGVKPFDCPHCDKKFRTSGHRKTHIMSHFKESNLPRKPRRALKRPGRSDIPMPDIPLQEPILITDTGLIQQPPRNSQLYSQYLGETGTIDRPFKCVHCSRGFKKSSHLKQHVRSHTGEKPYKCLQCLRSFVSSGVLKAHIRTHTGIKAYKCLVCDSMFTTNGSLKRHMSTHSEVRPFMCPYCQKTFKTSVNCKKHMKTHKHELAIQAIQEQQQQTGVGSQDAQQADAGQISLQEELVGHQPQLEQQTIAQDITQTMQEAGFDMQHTLTQPVFDQQQNFSQNLIGNNQQNLNQLNYQQNQFGLQTNQLQSTLDTLTYQPATSIGQTLDGGDMQNINLLQRDGTVTQQQVPRPRVLPMETEDGRRTYQCCYCDKLFKKSSHLKQHERSHTGEKPYKCLQCGRMFVSGGVLKAHMKTHAGLKEFECHVCNASFTTNGSLTRHMTIHSSVRPFKCMYCGEMFRSMVHLKRHVKEHTVIEESHEFSQRRARVTMLLSDEQTAQLSKPEEEMTMSEKILQESAAEKQRISEIKDKNLVSNMPKHAHQCEQCPKSFKKPSDLVRHNRIHTGEKPFNCDQCGRGFTVKSTLDSHMKTHVGAVKPFKCHVCNSSFATKGTLKVHMRLHTGAKPFKCPHCDLRFRTSGHRKSHIQSHFKQDIVEKKVRKPSQRLDALSTAGEQAMSLLTDGGQPATNVISIDQSLLQSPNIMPVSLSVADHLGNINEQPTMQILQGFEGIQLHLTGGLGQGIQITGLDPSLLSQTVQIDASLLHQLQQQGNLNVTINPNVITQQIPADPSIIQQAGGASVAEAENTNVIVQPLVTSAETSGIVASDGTVTFSIPSDSQALVAGTPIQTLTLNPDGQPTQLQLRDGQIIQTTGQAVTDGQESVEVMDTINEEEEVNAVDGEQTSGTFQAADSLGRIHLCHICDKGFKRSSHLKEHLLTHAPRGQPASLMKVKSSMHICPHCDKGFSKPSQLERHIRIHTGERPFVCHVCDKAFNQKNALQIHLKKHSGERPHKCNYCDLAFTQKGNLKTHIKRAHHVEMVQSMNLGSGDAPVSDQTGPSEEGGYDDFVTDFLDQ